MKRIGALVGVALFTGLLASPVLGAVTRLQLSTPYPSVAVQPGADVAFDLSIAAPSAGRVRLALSGAPDGWTATLRGGGFEVDSVFVDPDAPATARLDVKVPDTAPAGTTKIVVTATGDGGLGTDRLELEIRVATAAGGSVSLESDIPQLKGRPDQTFTYNLVLKNDTSQAQTFTLATAGPDGWKITAEFAGSAQAASFSVDPGRQTSVAVSVTPVDGAASGPYAFQVAATGTTQNAVATLGVELSGTGLLVLSTPDQRLSTDAQAGIGTPFNIQVSNTGTAAIDKVTFSQSLPTNWTVTYSPETVEPLAPDEVKVIVATITPSNEAVAGDYNLFLRAAGPNATQSITVRVTVQASQTAALIGIGLIVLVIAGLLLVFRWFGRR